MSILDDKKALDIKVLKISELTTLADYFVIASASSTTAVRSLSDYVEEGLKEEIGLPQKDGKDGYNWLLMDYGDVIVHIFYKETREFYDFEKLWIDAESVDITKIVSKER